MPRLALKGLLAGFVAVTALALAAPSALAERHHPHARVVVGGHGPHGAHVVRFHRFGPGHISHLTVVQRGHWQHGRWWHGGHHGRIGWWWFASGIWYWYPEPVYPYPAEISAEAVYDYAPEGRSDDSWYYCEDPKGYYPYVKSCNGEWKPVPIAPQANADGAYGEPPMGDNDEESGDDQDDDQDMNDDDDDDNDDDSYSH